MKYNITCVCGEDVSVDAQNDEEAINKLVPAMDEHVAAKEHSGIPADMSEGQKRGMVQSKMVRQP